MTSATFSESILDHIASFGLLAITVVMSVNQITLLLH
jgi:hypothetical protein